MSGEIYKKCFRCREMKPLTEFYRETRSKDGYRGTCKTCQSEPKSVRDERYRTQLREGYRECSKCGDEKPLTEYHKKANGRFGTAGRCKECVKKYNAANAEVRRKRTAEWRKNNPERHREYVKLYAEKHRKGVHIQSHPITPEGTRRCNKCDAVKLLEDYDLDPTLPSGYRARCKECRRESKRKRYKEAREADPKTS